MQSVNYAVSPKNSETKNLNCTVVATVLHRVCLHVVDLRFGNIAGWSEQVYKSNNSIVKWNHGHYFKSTTFHFYRKKLWVMVLDHEDIFSGSKCMRDSRKWPCGTRRSDNIQCTHTSWEGCFERSKEEGWKDDVLHTSSHAWENTPKSCISKANQGSTGHQSMHERILPRVASAKKTKEALDIFQTSYQGMDIVNTSKL